ncbi:MAG TPA: cytochrome c [Bacilli bacterium]|nr:cytochrome c [Bacilli bacterium]
MKGSPLMPFLLTAILGILLMLAMSFYGLNQKQAAEAGEVEEEVTEIEDPIAAGEEFVQKSCIGCHGNELQGASGPALDALNGKLSEEEIVEVITKGRGGMPAMPYNDVEAQAIATYLLDVSK